MRNPFIVILASVLVMGSADTAARELRVEPHAMFYYQVPFDGGAVVDKENSFGFRVDHIMHSPDHAVEYAGLMQRPAILDLRLNRHGVRSFRISGVDYLKQYRIHRAAGEDDGQETADTETNGNGDPEGEEELPQAPKVVRDVGNTITFLMEKAPVGVLIGAGIGIGLLVGSASD